MTTDQAGMIFKGDVYFDILDGNGAVTGLSLAGNATLATIKAEGEIQELKGRGISNDGITLESANKLQDVGIEIDFDRPNKEVLAAIFLGELTEVTQTADVVTTEAHYANPGKALLLDFRAGVFTSLTGDGGTPSFVENTDYTIANMGFGLIDILEGGTIVAEDVEANYTKLVENFDEVTVGTQPIVRVRVFLYGKSLSTGKAVYVTAWDVMLTPEEGVDVLSAEFNTVKLPPPT